MLAELLNINLPSQKKQLGLRLLIFKQSFLQSGYFDLIFSQVVQLWTKCTQNSIFYMMLLKRVPEAIQCLDNNRILVILPLFKMAVDFE